jgi:phosphoribosylformylglycinamidine (FGAM) synthase-like amidotransferase family enzyme
MPHPERACERALGSTDGLIVLESVVRSLKSGALIGQA